SPAEILLGRARRRSVVVGQVKMRDAKIECAAQHGAHILERIHAAEIVPEAQRDGRQAQAAGTATAVRHFVVALVVGKVHGRLLSTTVQGFALIRCGWKPGGRSQEAEVQESEWRPGEY